MRSNFFTKSEPDSKTTANKNLELQNLFIDPLDESDEDVTHAISEFKKMTMGNAATIEFEHEV